LRVVLQRVSRASVSWADGRGEIGPGFLVLVGVGPSDSEATALKMAEKVCQVRVFRDEAGRMNKSLEESGGSALVVSQFTLYADLSRGRRPGFAAAADPADADRLYLHFAAAIEARGTRVVTGSFGADMEVELVNSGPVTLVISSDDWATRAAGLV